LVLDHRRALQAGDEGDLAITLRRVDVLHGGGEPHQVLLGEVGEPEAEGVDHVVPLPAVLAGDAGGAGHEVVDHGGEPGVRQALGGGAPPAGGGGGGDLGGGPRPHGRRLGQREHDSGVQQAVDALQLLLVQAEVVGGYAAQLGGELEG